MDGVTRLIRFASFIAIATSLPVFLLGINQSGCYSTPFLGRLPRPLECFWKTAIAARFGCDEGMNGSDGSQIVNACTYNGSGLQPCHATLSCPRIEDDDSGSGKVIFMTGNQT